MVANCWSGIERNSGVACAAFCSDTVLSAVCFLITAFGSTSHQQRFLLKITAPRPNSSLVSRRTPQGKEAKYCFLKCFAIKYGTMETAEINHIADYLKDLEVD